MKATNNCKRSCAAPYLKVGVQRRSDAVRHSRGLPGGRSATTDCPCMHPRGSSAILWLLQFCNKYFEFKKNSWDCHPNSNYMLSSFASQDTTTSQNNATTCKKYEHTRFHSGMDTHTFPFLESFLIWSCTKQSG